MSVEKLDCTVKIIDNIVEIIPSKPIESNSIYEIVIKGLRPIANDTYFGKDRFKLDNSELDAGVVVKEPSPEDVKDYFVNDYKIRVITAMAPMYCNIIDVESLIEIAEIPDEMILYNIREASKYADYVYKSMYESRRHKNFKIKKEINKEDVPYAVKEFVRYKATKDCLMKIYMALATNKMLEGALGEVKFKVRETMPDIRKLMEYLDGEIQKWLDAIKGYDLEGRTINETAVKGYWHMYITPKRTPLSFNRGTYNDRT